MTPPADATSELDAIVAELYALPPEQFTAARNVQIAAAHRALAAQLKTLRKPTAAAWAVSLLARTGGLTEVLELATSLREAQDDLDAAELGRLSTQRRALVGALATRAVTLAGENGVTVSAAARVDVEKTINAAVMDAAAAAAVMTGRLTRALEASGFDAVDLTDAVAGGAPDTVTTTVPDRDDLARRRARKAAERAVREAERAVTEADRERTRLAARLEAARERADLLHERIDGLRDELARLEVDAEKAELESARLEQAHAEAASLARTAQRDAESARRSMPTEP